MAYGLVRRMRDNFFDTPNRGELIDLETGTQYNFTRPDTDGTSKPIKWNVCKGDIVMFTISNGVATNVTLHKVRKDKMVYGQFPIFGSHSLIEGASRGTSAIVVQFGGRLMLVGSTSGNAGLGL